MHLENHLILYLCTHQVNTFLHMYRVHSHEIYSAIIRLKKDQKIFFRHQNIFCSFSFPCVRRLLQQFWSSVPASQATIFFSAAVVRWK